MPLSGKEMLQLYLRTGWCIERIRGSHYILVKEDKTVVIPVHSKELGERLRTKIIKTWRFQMISYPAVFHEEENSWWVEFPDLEGCLSDGKNFEEAVANAAEALNLYLESLDSRKLKAPEPSKLQGENIKYISPRLNISFAITLKYEREKQGLTQMQVAERSGIAWAVYQRIENPRKSNPTLSTIAKIQAVLGTNCL